MNEAAALSSQKFSFPLELLRAVLDRRVVFPREEEYRRWRLELDRAHGVGVTVRVIGISPGFKQEIFAETVV